MLQNYVFLLGFLVTQAVSLPDGQSSFALIDLEGNEDDVYAGFDSPLARNTISMQGGRIPAVDLKSDYYDLNITVASSPAGEGGQATTSAMLSLSQGNLTDRASYNVCVYVLGVDDPEFHKTTLDPGGGCGSVLDACESDLILSESPCSSDFILPDSCADALGGNFGEYSTTMKSNLINYDGFFTYTSDPHPLDDTAVGDQMVDAVFPVWTVWETAGDHEGLDGSLSGGLMCIRAAGEEPLQQGQDDDEDDGSGSAPPPVPSQTPPAAPTTTTTISSSSTSDPAGPTAVVRTEHLLGAAAVAAGWGLL